MEVVETESMTATQKLKVLKRWEADANDLEVAANENMAGGESSRLGEVRKQFTSYASAKVLMKRTATICHKSQSKFRLGPV